MNHFVCAPNFIIPATEFVFSHNIFMAIFTAKNSWNFQPRKGSFSIGSCPADAFSSVSGLTERIQHLLELNASHQASKDDEQEQSSKRLPLINNDVDMGRTPPKLRMGAEGEEVTRSPLYSSGTATRKMV